MEKDSINLSKGMILYVEEVDKDGDLCVSHDLFGEYSHFIHKENLHYVSKIDMVKT